MKSLPLSCIDANILVYALLSFPLSEQAGQLLASFQTENIAVVVPALFSFEVTSTLHRLHHLGEITAAEEAVAFDQFLRMPVHHVYDAALFVSARQLAQQFDRPRTYDTAYLAVALRYNCDFWTADKRLCNAVTSKLSWVHWIGDFASQSSPNADD